MKPHLQSDQRGVVYAEFLMAFMPLFVLFLGVIQLCFIGASSLVVQNAAMKGARAAMVVLPDDPFFYDGEDVLTLDFQGSSDSSGMVDGLTDTLGKEGVEDPSKGSDGESKKSSSAAGVGGPRLNQIRLATNVSLAPIAPQPELLLAWMPAGLGLDGVLNAVGIELPKLGIRKGAIGTSPVARFFTGLLVYNSMAAAINFPEGPGEKALRNAGGEFEGKVVYERNEEVTVRVTYLYPCTVPIVSRFICQTIYPGPDSWVAKVKRYGDEIGNGGQGVVDRVRARGEQIGGYAEDQWNGFKDDFKGTVNAPRNAAMDAARCLKSEAIGFKDGLREQAFALRDGVVDDVQGLRRGLKSDALGLRDGVVSDAQGLVDGTRSDVQGLGRGLVTDGKNLVGGLKGDAQRGLRELEAEGARLRQNIEQTGRDVTRGIGNDLGELRDGVAADGRDAVDRLPALGDYSNITGPADDAARAGNELTQASKDLYGVGEDVYRLGQSPYDPFTAVPTAVNATNTIGRVVQTTDSAGRRVVVGLSETGQQVVKTFGQSGAYVEQTVNRAGELVVVTVDRLGNRVETTVDKAGNRIDRGIDQAGNHVIVARDRAGKVITTTVDGMGNRVVESYDQAQGRVITTIDSLGNRTVTTFDSAKGRVDTAYTSAETRVETTYDSLGNRTRTAYDGATRRYESTIDGVNKCTENGYDAMGQLLDDPTKAFTDRADRIQKDVSRFGKIVDSMTAEDWEDELLGALREQTPEEKELMDELHAGIAQPDLLDMLLLADNARFYVLRREATLPIQGAHYRYPTFKKFENKDDGERADAR